MSESTNEAGSGTSGVGTSVLRAVLLVAAVMMIAGGIAIAALTVWDASERAAAGAAPVAMGVTVSVALGAVLGGIFLAVLLLGVSALLKPGERAAEGAAAPVVADDLRPALGRLEQLLKTLNAMQTRAEVSSPREAHVNGTGLVSLMEQLRDYTLMSDAQRERFAARHWARRRETLTDVIERDVLVGDWVAAFGRLEDLQLLMPDEPRVHELRERVESEQSARLEEDMRLSRNQFKHLVSISAWQQAEEMAGEMQRKYPGKVEARQFAEDVRREREAYERENMERLFRDITAATEKRQWRPAVLAVEEFIRRYPTDPRAEALRLDLPTLNENAASQERKEQEESFKDLLKRQRYEEAYAVARAAIQKYPNSPTATELNKLLPRVEELARQEATRQATATAAAPAVAAAT